MFVIFVDVVPSAFDVVVVSIVLGVVPVTPHVRQTCAPLIVAGHLPVSHGFVPVVFVGFAVLHSAPVCDPSE
jgi:hypothetical protein